MSAVERWRMPSGRIAVIDLLQEPEAIEDARRLLREFGDAELINEEAPEAVAPAVEGEDQTTNTHEGEPIMAIISDTTDALEDLGPVRPIYSPADPRWAPLAEHIARHPDTNIVMDDLWPRERAERYELLVLGIDYSRVYDWQRDVSYPDFPDVTSPSWATASAASSSTEYDEPEKFWYRELGISEGLNAATILQEATFHPDNGEVSWDEPVLSIWFTSNDSVRYRSAADAREAARALLAAADQFEQLAEGAR